MRAVLLLGLFGVALAAEKCCPEVNRCFNDVYPFNHLDLPRCFTPNFQMFTRSAPGGQFMTKDNIPSSFSPSRKTIFIVHGYLQDREWEWMADMKNEFLRKGDFNVIIVGWGAGSQELYYPQSASNTRVTGTEIGNVANVLMGRGLSRSNLYCVGHSLGGHTCGHAGKFTKFGRISGLDPAGPMFESYPSEARLGPGDATFVDVSHTMGKEGLILDFGTLLPMGHVDFYPNGGGIQPGCLTKEMHDKERRVCSHNIVTEFFTESINSNRFLAKSSCTNEKDIPGSCSSCGNCQSMGYSADQYGARGKFYMTTNPDAPYAQG